jgi:diguanylate cyclase (GGDEF)-like protein
MAGERILLIDDEPDKIFIFRTILQHNGFDVSTAESGEEGVKRIMTERPDLVLLDINMPDVNGHVIRQKLKERPATRYVPIVMFSSSDQLSDKLESLRSGADDYITKSVDHQELVARLEALVRRYKDNIGANPLTRLPGNHAIEDTINRRIDQSRNGKTPFAVCYADMDNFKAFNDVYGFQKGDEAIQKTAEVIVDTAGRLGTPHDFVGHVGGDDFVFVLSDYSTIENICQEILDRVNAAYPLFYSDEDRARGYIITKNRKDELDRFPLMSLSIGVVSNENRDLTSVGQIVQIATELKKVLKTMPGSNYRVDRRS